VVRLVLMKPPETETEHLDTGGTKKKPPRESHPRSRTPGGAQANLTLSSEKTRVNPATDPATDPTTEGRPSAVGNAVRSTALTKKPSTIAGLPP
jgi:hypothetical protein